MSCFLDLQFLGILNYPSIFHQIFFNRADFQSRDLEDRETQEATMSVCMYVCHKTLIRFKSMNSSVNSFPE